MNEITLRPLTIHWSEWKRRYDTLVPPKKLTTAGDLLNIITTWQRGVNAWFNGLTDQQQEDLLSLAAAEIEMLWTVVDPAAHAPSGYFPGAPTEDDRYDFRQRYFAVQALLTMVERFGHGPHGLRSQLTDLERYAQEKRGWLP